MCVWFLIDQTWCHPIYSSYSFVVRLTTTDLMTTHLPSRTWSTETVAVGLAMAVDGPCKVEDPEAVAMHDELL